ncbi:hypothetical protein IV73_GL000239 [Weissella kandleri]|uniref:UPF0398 protein IV73_GL000239 n=2 Tax=Weissella kandleri TaxID=1616 RepID=A0A0R2JNX8_9LACO|nr:hypothetical protein IV73_GL000239 [Weissella kandleri]
MSNQLKNPLVGGILQKGLKKMERIWITGFRSFELGVFGAKDPKVTVLKFALKKQLTSAIEDGATWLITGGQLGIEQYALEVGNQLRTEYPEFKTALMTPFQDFGQNWNENNRALLGALQASVDFTQAVSQKPYQDPSQLKNYQNFMLQHTERAIVVYDQQAETSKVQYTVQAIQNYQKHTDYEVTLIDFDRLQEYSEEYAETLNDWE